MSLSKTTDYRVYVGRMSGNGLLGPGGIMKEIPWTKYQIKETDFRIKTATLTTPTALDLTKGRVIVKIISKKHENFIGVVLDDDYTENDDGTHTYKLQDMSRQYMNKFELISTKATNYRILQYLITRGGIPVTGEVTEETKEKYASILTGLRSLAKYEGAYMGNPISINMMAQKPKLISRNKSMMEVIREICFANAYVDVFWGSNGVLQIKPINLKDWENTGLHLTAGATSKRQFSFDTTNSITKVLVASTEQGQLGSAYDSKTLIGLDLGIFFGYNATSTSNPNQSSSSSTKTKAATTTKKTTTTGKAAFTPGKNGNPFNNKAKRIIVSEDRGGTPGFKSGIIKRLKADGWSVTDLGTGPGTHTKSYDVLSTKYAVNMTMYNGVDPKTIDEPVTSNLKGKHEKYGVQLVQVFDSHGWKQKVGKYNKKGIYYKRNGDFRGYRVPKAWDDNYSGAKGGVLIEDLHKWYLKYYPKVLYCCGTSVSEVYKQFKAGGYLKMKRYVK